MTEPFNGKAQIFETMGLWRPLEQRKYAATQHCLLLSTLIYKKSACFCNKFVCLVCYEVQLFYFCLTKHEGEGGAV